MIKAYEIDAGGTADSHFERQLRYNMAKHARPPTPTTPQRSPAAPAAAPNQLAICAPPVAAAGGGGGSSSSATTAAAPAVDTEQLRRSLRAARPQLRKPPHERSGRWTLNFGQYHAAVAPPSAMVLVTAGPGTGKTETTVARIAHLLALGVPPEQIRGISFTRAAAGEVRAPPRAHGTRAPVTPRFPSCARRTAGGPNRRQARVGGGEPAREHLPRPRDHPVRQERRHHDRGAGPEPRAARARLVSRSPPCHCPHLPLPFAHPITRWCHRRARPDAKLQQLEADFLLASRDARLIDRFEEARALRHLCDALCSGGWFDTVPADAEGKFEALPPEQRKRQLLEASRKVRRPLTG